jgi:RNA polymerase sigma-70 factor (ECF subfamily)
VRLGRGASGNTSRTAGRRIGGPAVATVEHAAPRAAAATELLYRRHAQRVWRYCLSCLRRPADAEDALQQTFLQAHRALGRGVEPVSEAAWLLTIARNVCLTRADAHRRRDRVELTEDPLLLDELLWAEDADEGVSAEVQAAFARLPERQRQALFLREWQECSYAEIAAALGTSESAVETLLFRARRTLAQELGGSRRRIGGLAGLLGWLRTAVGTTASKLAIGAAVVAATAAGTEVALSPHAKHASLVRHSPVTMRVRSLARPSVSHTIATHVRHRPLQRQVAATTVSPVQNMRGGTPPPPAPTAPIAAAPGVSAALAPAAASAPAGAAPAPRPTQPTATSTPPATTIGTTTTTATTTVASTTSAVANTATTATGAVSSAVDSAAQTVSSAAPATAPVVNTAAQTVDTAAQTVNTAAQTVDNTVQSTSTTVSNLLPAH